MEENLARIELPAAERSQVGLVAQAGISEFIAWFRAHEDSAPSAISIFAKALQELTRTVSLRQTLDLVRTVVDVVEARVESLAGPGDEQLLRESVLRFSREIAFAAAEVYAGAAEARGAWDARLEALVVDAVLRGEADDSMQSRAAALGWDEVGHVTVVVGPLPDRRWRRRIGGRPATCRATRGRRGAGHRAAHPAHRDPRRHRGPLGRRLGRVGPLREGPIVVGPTVPHLFAAGRSARAALSGPPPPLPGPRRRGSWSPRPCFLSAPCGRRPAQRLLVDQIHRPLARSAQRTLLASASSPRERRFLEATSRALFIHPNTVRYRLGRIEDLTHFDLTAPRDAWAARIALALGRLSAAERATVRALDRRWRKPPNPPDRVRDIRVSIRASDQRGWTGASDRVPRTGLPDPGFLTPGWRSTACATSSSASPSRPVSTSSLTARPRMPRPSRTPRSPSPSSWVPA